MQSQCRHWCMLLVAISILQWVHFALQPSGGGRMAGCEKEREWQYPFLGDLLIYARCSECCYKNVAKDRECNNAIRRSPTSISVPKYVAEEEGCHVMCLRKTVRIFWHRTQICDVHEDK